MFGNAFTALLGRAIDSSVTEEKIKYKIDALVTKEKQFGEKLRILTEVVHQQLMLRHDEYFHPVISAIFQYLERLHLKHQEFLGGLQTIEHKRTNLDRCNVLRQAYCLLQGHMQVTLEYTENLPRVDSILDFLKRQPNRVALLQMIKDVERQVKQQVGWFESYNLSHLLLVPKNKISETLCPLREITQLCTGNSNERQLQRQDLERIREMLEDYSQCINQIQDDNCELREIEVLQNQIQGLPERLSSLDTMDELSMLGYNRRNLYHFGRLRAMGTCNMKRTTEQGYVPKYLILLDELCVICTIMPNACKQPYRYERSFEVTTDFSIQWISEVTVRISAINLPGGADPVFLDCQGTVEMVQRIGQAYNTILSLCKVDAGDGSHNYIPSTFPVGSKCDVCGKLFRGNFRQGYMCVNFFEAGCYDRRVSYGPRTQAQKRRRGCYKKVHKECLILADMCPLNRDRAPDSPEINQCPHVHQRTQYDVGG